MQRHHGVGEDLRAGTVGGASACATQLRLYGYQEIRRILERGDDADFLSKDDIDDEVHQRFKRLPVCIMILFLMA